MRGMILPYKSSASLYKVAHLGGQEGHGPPDPVKISHKKMTAKGNRIDFMFLAPPTRPLDPLLVNVHEH